MDAVPSSPRETLHRFLGALAADPTVRNVYAGGSIAREEDDEVSDLDLWIEGESWSPESLGGLFLTAELKTLSGIPFLHGVSVGGTIIDILIGTPSWEGYKPLDLPKPSPIDPAPLPRCGLVEEYWSMTLKHRKNLWRGRHWLLTYGLHHDRRYLLRAWAMKANGTDPGEQVFTLFALKTLYSECVDDRRLELLGLPLRNLDEILYAVQAYRDEMTNLFPETTQLEATVRALPLIKPN